MNAMPTARSLAPALVGALALAAALPLACSGKDGSGAGQSRGTAGGGFLKGWPMVDAVEGQPLVQATKRLVAALRQVGAPLDSQDTERLEVAYTTRDTAAIQSILDPHCIAGVDINAEGRVSVTEGNVSKELVHGGWRSFLVKVHNQPRITSNLTASSEQATWFPRRGMKPRERPTTDPQLPGPGEYDERFLGLEMWDEPPLKPRLSSLELEYRIVQIYSNVAGKREAQLGFSVGQGTQDIGFRGSVPILFTAVPSVKVVLGVKDSDGEPCVASFTFRDRLGRVYPNRMHRIAPDFFFHDQVYRGDGEEVSLAPGSYTVEVTRGPEYVVQQHKLTVEAGNETQRAEYRLKRWVHPAARGWFSGDHHIHAAGCMHYDTPTEGVGPDTVMQQVQGEGLNVGCVLTWGQCWYHQKKNFEGKVSALSTADHVIRYDVEVSGFPSGHCGHVCLLGLTEDDYPGATKVEEWPSWTLPILRWGKKQGAVVGFAHTGWGMALPDYAKGQRIMRDNYVGLDTRRRYSADKLPDYYVPDFSGVGANAYLMAVANNACDFLGIVDTPSIHELNIWYHATNCGFRTRISGESDFPCVYDERIGYGRSYVKLPDNETVDYAAWLQGIKDGRSYCGDGRSHILDFKVDGVAVGEPGPGGKISQLEMAKPGTVKATFDVAALLAAKPNNYTRSLRRSRRDNRPFWHIERCRVANTRMVPVEVIVNGEPVEEEPRKILADGTMHSLSFDLEITRSSWVAVRILPSVHTNPVYIVVGGKPIRANKKSAEWCRKALDVCWKSTSAEIGADEQHKGERQAARKAYDRARKVFDRLIRESDN